MPIKNKRTKHNTVPVECIENRNTTYVMGGQQSKVTSGGSLQGAYAPSITQVPQENLPSKDKKRTFAVRVPATVRGVTDGVTTMVVSIGDGASKRIKMPKGLKKGDKFTFSIVEAETDKVFASTLPTIPGMEVVQSKPIIWGSVSHSFLAGQHNQQVMGQQVGQLMQDAQAKILEQVLEHGCNAVLGMTFNVTNDSSGEYGNKKIVIVTACGTPCIVVPTTTAIAVDADVIIEPLYG